jgi:hypothetical protein
MESRPTGKLDSATSSTMGLGLGFDGAVIAAVITLITATKITLIAPSSHPF